MKRILFIVNGLASLKPDQSTADLLTAALHSCSVWVGEMRGLSATPDGIAVRAYPWRPSRKAARKRAEFAHISSFDAVWIRTNPGRATGPHSDWLELLSQAEDSGTLILNRPSGLRRAATKSFLSCLPRATIPRTWSGSNADELLAHLETLGGPAVIKPANGTRGDRVEKLRPGMPESREHIERALSGGAAILQDYLEDAPNGDVRVHLVAGEILSVGGRECAVRRQPQQGQWRSNVALGAVPMRASLTDEQRGVCIEVGPTLRRLGLWHVGLDLVGDRIVEVNVCSPGGLADASRFEDRDFVGALVERFLDDGIALAS